MTKIYYFSGTGNTLWSAKKIAGKTGSQCELINIGTEAQKKEIIIEADAVVLLYPAYAYGAPIIVRKFVKKAVFKTPYIAAFVTMGSSPGGALAEICRILKRKHKGATYFGRIPAVENYIPIFGSPGADYIKERTNMQEKATDEAAICLIEKRTNRINTFRPFSAFVSVLFSLGLKLFYRWYRLEASCDSCGLCEKVCPVSAITIKGGRPVFSKKCEHCQGCINWCPKHAINFGTIKSGTPRYHHPEIKAGDILR